MRLYFPLILVFIFCTQQVFAQPVPGNQQQRIKNISHIEPGTNGRFTTKDSLSFRYSDNRGSVFNAIHYLNTIYYDPLHYGFFSYDGYMVYIPASLYAEKMPSPLYSFSMPTTDYDTMWGYSIYYDTMNNRSIGQKSRMIKQYLNSKPVIIDIGNDSLIRRTTINHTYDMKPRDIYAVNFVTKKNDTTGIRRIDYDNNGYTKSDTSYEFLQGLNSIFIKAHNYQYDNTGKVVSISEYNDYGVGSALHSKEIFTYNGKGNLIRLEKQSLNMQNEWKTVSVTDFIYDDKDRLTSMTDTLGPLKDPIFTLHYNDKGEVDTLVQNFYDQLWGSKATHKTIFYYNEYHNPDSAISFVNRIQSDSEVYITYYEYETYFKDTIYNTDPLVLIPNPAHGQFGIKWNGMLPVVPVTVSIYNDIGQLVHRQSIQKAQFVDTISIPSLYVTLPFSMLEKLVPYRVKRRRAHK